MFSSQNSQVSSDVNYIEDVFSTYLYTGNGSTQTITNGIDLAGKGGLVWGKSRSNAYDNFLADSVRGSSKLLYSNNTYAQQTDANVFSSFNSNGFSLGIGGAVSSNTNGATYASWTFREQPKFFDVVTYTGTGVARTVSHNLGSVPGCIIVKRTDIAGFDWPVYHVSTGNTNRLLLNDTVPAAASSGFWNDTTPTSTVFTVGSNVNTNASGGTYVAYIFAHDAGGFGLTGTDNVISCGSFTASASETATVTLGYEPQFLLFKPSSTTGDWQIVDTMRPWPVAADAFSLKPNTSAAEANFGAIKPSSTGFYATSNLTANATYIYIAIRRGPMKVPTLGTSVFSPNTYTGTGATLSVSGLSFPPDMVIPKWRSNGGGGYSTRPGALYDKLRGSQQELAPTSDAAESTQSTGLTSFNQSGFTIGTSSVINSNPDPYISWNFRRAPGFFDEVCYTGTGSSNTISHNLTVIPELIISKQRSGVNNWLVSSPSLGKAAYLNTVDAFSASYVVYGSVTSASFTALYSGSIANGSGQTYVAYLFATCPGVSKVGTYTGTAAAQTINCGFTSGARFVLIKRFDAQPDTTSGPWYVWDSARGITSGNDPYLLLNSTGAEVTSLNYVDTDATGFKLTTDSGPQKALNDSGGTYIFLAIA